jgi:hypothetical protein
MSLFLRSSLIFFVFTNIFFSQTDLLNEIDFDQDIEVSSVFKSLKVVNFESTKLISSGEFAFSVSHRFGSIKYGFENFFGLDDAITRLNFIYGLNDYSNLSISRSSYNKTFDVALKARLIAQNNEFPFTLVLYSSLTIDSSLDDEIYPKMSFNNRTGYFTQFIISRKLNKNLSAILSPSFFHENLVVLTNQNNSQYGVIFGGRYKISKRTSFNIDYGYHFNRSNDSIFKNPLGIGLDIETGGHVFQLLFSNSQSMNAINLMSSSTGDWTEGDVFFGFNLYRTF